MCSEQKGKTNQQILPVISMARLKEVNDCVINIRNEEVA
jgi:hypothetical protein